MINWIKKEIKFFLLKRKFIKSKIYKGVVVDNSTVLGKHSVVFENTILINSHLDDYSYIQKNSEIVNTKIGKFCSIASNVTIGLANHPTHLFSTSPVFYDCSQPLPFFFTDKIYKKELILETIIGADVWIGQGVMIKSGVTIGVGAVIGAGAVVVKDVEAYSVVGGVPAKHIKYRFEENLRKELINSKWWILEDSKLIDLTRYLNSPKEFLEQCKRVKNVQI